MQGAVAQTFRSAGSRDFPVPCCRSGTGDWKVARTRRLEGLRHGRNVLRFRSSGSNAFWRAELLRVTDPRSGEDLQKTPNRRNPNDDCRSK